MSFSKPQSHQNQFILYLMVCSSPLCPFVENCTFACRGGMSMDTWVGSTCGVILLFTSLLLNWVTGCLFPGGFLCSCVGGISCGAAGVTVGATGAVPLHNNSANVTTPAITATPTLGTMMASSITFDGPVLSEGLGVGAGVSLTLLVIGGGAGVVLVVGLGGGGVDGADVVVVVLAAVVVLVVGWGVVVVLVVGLGGVVVLVVD